MAGMGDLKRYEGTSVTPQRDWTAGSSKLDEEDEELGGGGAVTAVAQDTAGPWGIDATADAYVRGQPAISADNSPQRLTTPVPPGANDWREQVVTPQPQSYIEAQNTFIPQAVPTPSKDYMASSGKTQPASKTAITGISNDMLFPTKTPVYPDITPITSPLTPTIIPTPQPLQWGDEQPDNPVNPEPAPTSVSPLGNSWANNGAPVNWLSPSSGGLAPTSMNIPAVTPKWNDPLPTTITDPTKWNPEMDLASRIDARGGYVKANPLGYGASADTIWEQTKRENPNTLIDNNYQAGTGASPDAILENMRRATTPKKTVITPLKKNFWGSGGGRGGGGGGGNWQAILGNMNWKI